MLRLLSLRNEFVQPPMPHTRPFRLEREMLDPLNRALPTVLGFPSSSHWIALREPTIGSVIPDLLIGVAPEVKPVRSRRRCTVLEAHVVALLEGTAPLSTLQIIESLYLTRMGAEYTLGRLHRSGVLVQTEGDHWTIAEAASTAGIEIVAIEAKLRRWRDALAQASAYRTFANRVYAVLDGNQVTRSDILVESFQDAGVGLLLQYGPLVEPVVQAPRFDPPPSPHRIQAADKLFGRCSSRTTTEPSLPLES
jgi:hypothetical protein